MCSRIVNWVFATIVLMTLSSGMASAEVNLQITEVWPGGLPGTDATSDWFEVTNFGDTVAENLDGNLFYDDNSDDATSGDALMGIDTIAPGESVIYLVAWENVFDNVREAAVEAFVSMWQPIGGVQIGVINFGGGLGTEGDAVNIFNGNTADALTIDRAAYEVALGEPSFVADAHGTWVPNVAETGVLGARLGNRSANDMDAGPPIGSPGVVPEPSAWSLMGVALMTAWCGRRRRSAGVSVHRVRAALAAPGHAGSGARRWSCVSAGTFFWLAIGFAASSARAQSNLQITEIWPGALPGTEFTSDWFEVTNFGDVAATGLDGNLYFDDSSSDPLQSDVMVGIDTIVPGESVIYLTTWEDGFNNVVEDAIAAFVTMWQPPPSLQIGSVTLGSGFGGEGDAANIYLGNDAEAVRIDQVEYSGPAMGVESFVSDADGTWLPSLAQIGVLGAYAGFQPADNLSPDPPVASPGTVPEPTSLSLLLAAAALIGRPRNRSPRREYP